MARPRRRQVRLAALALLALVAGVGCDEQTARSRGGGRPEAGTVAPVDEDAESARTDPPALAGDLKADIDGFTSIDACVAAHAGIDPLVGDALEAIGYDTLLRDACRSLEAAKTRSSKPCDDIAASGLRARCVGRVAELTAAPDDCPWDVPSRPERGRDPVCLAIATGDTRLCAAALATVDRTACEAVVARAAGPCGKLGVPADRARCERDAKRWSGIAAATSPSDARKLAESKASVADTTADDAGVEGAALDVSRGLVVVERIDGAHVILGPSLDAGSGFVVPSPNSPATLSLELVVPADSHQARVEGGELRRPGRATVSFDAPAAAGLTVRVAGFDRRRGGPVELSVAGVLRGGVHVDATASTFVRDVVKGSALLGPLRLGDGGGMR